MAECNCMPGGKPNPAGRCPVHHTLDSSKPDPYVRAMYAGRIRHRHHIEDKLVYDGPPHACPYCPKQLNAHQAR